MTPTASEIRMIPISAITVLNPRVRNKKIFNELVTSIAHLGLKKPITVSARPDQSGYDLVCGQGRLEAFMALGQTEIPAVVLEASEEDCFVMSLVENLARRHHSPIELMRQIGALRERGYSVTEIAAKTDFSDEYISAICYLLDHGEERLLAGIERGVIPTSVAMEIVRAKDRRHAGGACRGVREEGDSGESDSRDPPHHRAAQCQGQGDGQHGGTCRRHNQRNVSPQNRWSARTARRRSGRSCWSRRRP